MMKSYLITIVVPVYNQKRSRLERCIHSLCSQTYSNLEILIVDDGSREECLRDLSDICKDDSRIRVISQENKGAGMARNHGVAEAKGDYIVFVDSDDMLSEYAMEDAVDCLCHTEADLVVGQIHKEREKDWQNTLFERQELQLVEICNENEFNEYINHIYGYLSNKFTRNDRYFCDGPIAKLCRSDILKKVYFDNDNFWGEDTIWNLKVTKQCQTVVVSENIWYYAFANEDSQTHIFRPNCEYEFCCRIKQENDLIKSLWPACLNGLYSQVWVTTHYLFACYFLPKENKNSVKEKYKVFLRCIKQPTYQEMLRNITFEDEMSALKKIIKKSIRYFSLYRPRFLAFIGWGATINLRKGER